MADSGLYDSHSDVSSIYDEASSDEESLVGSERPADGTSERHDEENNELDEQTQTASQAAKAIEAAGERSPVLSPEDAVEGTSQHPHSSATRHAAWEDDVPILDAGPAPPDYFAATAWRRSSLRNTMETHGVVSPRQQGQQGHEVQPGESEASLSHETLGPTEPGSDNVESEESRLVDQQDEAVVDETVPLLRPSYSKANKSTPRKSRILWPCTKPQLCVVSAVFVAMVMFAATLTAWLQDYETAEIPKHPENHGNPALDHPRTAKCNFNSYSGYFDVEFGNATSFSLLDDIDFSDTPELKDTVVSGNVEIIYVPENSTGMGISSIVALVHFATVLPWKVELTVEDLPYYKTGDEIVFERPNLRRSRSVNSLLQSKTSPPCLDVMILIYVREGTILERWDTSTFDLNIIDHEAAVHESAEPSARMMHPKARLFVANTTDIYSQRGKIDISYWNSNDTQLGTTRGSIAGAYQLHSDMNIRSESGSIDVSIDSALDAKNDTGLIPERSQYNRGLRTSTVSGHTKIKVLPTSTHHSSDSVYESSAERKTAHTNGISDVHDLIGNGFWGSLISAHSSKSGLMSVHYPSTWSGVISAWTFTAGNLSIIGDGIETTSDEDNRGFRMLTAHKGLEHNLLSIGTEDGEATLYIGDEYLY